MNARSNKLILVVDDSADNCTLLETVFRSKGWNVRSARNGARALEILDDSLQLPDLILLDLQMPTMNGVQFKLKQARDQRIRNIPVVIMSADIDSGEVGAMRPQGILNKPLNLKSLVNCVSSFLKH